VAYDKGVSASRYEGKKKESGVREIDLEAVKWDIASGQDGEDKEARIAYMGGKEKPPFNELLSRGRNC